MSRHVQTVQISIHIQTYPNISKHIRTYPDKSTSQRGAGRRRRDDGHFRRLSNLSSWPAAGADAPEQPAPMIAATPSPLNASRVRCRAPIRPEVASHLESR
eukprot:7316886-Prymnesium_polylepis.1